MGIDVEIYMNNIIKFFRNNPKDLQSLVPLDKENDFYTKIREVATQNSLEGKDANLTQKQLIEVCVSLNQKKEENLDDRVFKNSKFGLICLN